MLNTSQCSLCVKHSMLNARQDSVFQVFFFNAASIVCDAGVECYGSGLAGEQVGQFETVGHTKGGLLEC